MASRLDRSFPLTLTLLAVFFILLLFQTKTTPAQNSAQIAAPVRERLSLDRGWLFHEGDIPFPVITDKLHAESWWTHGPTMKLMVSEYLKYVVARMRMRLDPAATARAAGAELASSAPRKP